MMAVFGMSSGAIGMKTLGMKTLHEVDDGEDPFACEPAFEVLDVRQRVAVSYGDVVEAPVVTAGTPASAWLGCDVERRSPGRRGRTNHAEILHLLEGVLRNGQHVAVQMTRTGVEWWSLCDEVMNDTVADLIVGQETRHQELQELVED